ncbi:MAG: hypothetical protein JXA42_04665, partial [Anaerolineales bacterium]|nr:hypothetical protein [Anaerolineales bacterium]
MKMHDHLLGLPNLQGSVTMLDFQCVSDLITYLGTSRPPHRQKRFVVILCLILCMFLNPVLIPSSISEAQEEEEKTPMIAVFSTQESVFADVIAGGTGTAYLIYFLPENSPEQPSLVIRLSRNSLVDDALAEVFDTPEGQHYVPIDFVNGTPLVPDRLDPTITITAIGGWWVRDGKVNFDLNIIVYGPIMTMWASGGQSGWARLLDHGEPNARIIVRDEDSNGLPDWDWRTMLPEFSNRGDYRTTYAESKCASPLILENHLILDWPYIAGNANYGFEQQNGILRPPIVVDWDTGQVQTVSEFVTLRNQNCTYGMHSITRVLPDQMNSPNFESPFAFYDLSGKGEGFPNLIIRTARTVLERDAEGLASEQIERIRYSWSNEDVGDLSMDYKVDLLGFHPYDFATAIADGRALIDVPPYDLLPGWL